MYLMLIGRAPFETTVVEKTYQRIAKGQFEFPQSFKDDLARDLIRKILVVDISKRLTFKEILDHPFMNPKCGIPKELPPICISQVPKFGIFEKYAQDQVKQSARSASIMTLRSSIDLSIDEDLGDQTIPTHTNRSNSKDVKGLLKSVFSTNSISTSLKKLTELGRSSSPQNKTIQPRLNRSSNNLSRSKGKEISLRPRSSIQEKLPQKKQMGFVYVLSYRQDVVWNYILSNGYIGTYETNYKVLFNKHDNIYFEVDQRGMLKKIRKGDEIMNENIVNRKKFIKNYREHPLECQPYISQERVIYITKIYKVQSENIILFKLSNEHIQACQYKKNLNLLLTNEDILLIEIENGREVSRFMEKKENYAKCSTKMLELYLSVKKILMNISKAKKSK